MSKPLSSPLARLRGLIAPQTLGRDLPLFPLNTVLFPGGRLRLKVFEARYLDMAADCLRESRPFGVCLIKQGGEVGPAALPEAVGCHARIVTADMGNPVDSPGVMLVEARGEGRFVVESTRLEANQLLIGQVRDKDDEARMPVPAYCRGALTFLRALAARVPDSGLDKIQEDATWVSFRLAEVLPLKASARQAMLEMNDGVKRLEILLEFMRRNDLA
ncbi:MAG: LON peptidase substrate-binding domain-containing protein [Pseudomonadota bacterium]|nr:LON peptidase substrate-binding domain-containing protein [Pseudomonadota bacterium]